MPTIKAKLVALDVTDRHTIDDADKGDLVKIEDVFLFDANRETHCCEVTPSHFLVYLYTNLEFANWLNENVETEAMAYRKDELYQKYADEPTEDCYVHCHKVKNAVDVAEYPYREGDEEETYDNQKLDDYDDTFESIREHCAGNHYI